MRSVSKRAWLTAIVVVVGIAGSAGAVTPPAQLVDQNATVNFQTKTGSPTYDGALDWIVDGVDQLQQQWFWYRIGNTGGESSLSSLNLISSKLSDTNDNPGSDTMYLRYGDGTATGTSTFTIEVTFTLSGGTDGSGKADMGELIRITNKSSTARTFHFFQYSNFDLNNTASGENLTISGGNTVDQSETGKMFSETVVTPAPSHVQAGNYPNLWNLLGDGLPTTLNDTTTSSGDVAWAFQWDATLGRNGVLLISKDKNLLPVPEPSGLLALSLSGLLMLRRHGPARKIGRASRATAK